MDKIEARIREYLLVDCTSRTGLRWVKSPGSRAKAGAEAFTAINAGGYYNSKVLTKVLTAHRVVWFLTHGTWPVLLDHINGDKLDNRLENLRECTTLQNTQNVVGKGVVKGYTPVQRKGRVMYLTCVTLQGVLFTAGPYSTPAQARSKYLLMKAALHPSSKQRLK